MTLTATAATAIKHVGVYLRISRETGNENQDTLLSHRTIAERYCKDNDYSYHIYEEILSGASDIKSREALVSLLEDVKQNLYDAIFVISIDRISRDNFLAQYVAKVIADADIPVLTPEKVYDLNGDDRLLFDIQNVVSSQELRLISKRQRRGKREGVLRGEFVQGVSPLGYRRCEDNTSKNYKHLEIIEEEAKLIRMIFNYALNGYGIPSIVNKMAGYRTRSYKTSKGKWHEGKPFGISQVNTILKNRIYCGELTYQIKDKRGQIIETIITPDAHEPIIPMAQFNNVQSAIKGRLSGDLEKRNRSRGECFSILKDLLYCGICGKKMGIKRDSKRKDKVYVNKCSCDNKGIMEDKLLVEFWKELSIVEKQLRQSFQKVLETPTTKSKDSIIKSIDELNKREQKANTKLKNIRDAYTEGIFTKEEYLSDKTEVEKQLSSINSSISELSRELKQFDTETISSEYETKLKWLADIRKYTDRYNGKLFIHGKDIRNLPLPTIEKENIAEVNRLLKLVIDKVHYHKYNEETNLYEDGFIDVEKGDFIKVKISPK